MDKKPIFTIKYDKQAHTLACQVNGLNPGQRKNVLAIIYNQCGDTHGFGGDDARIAIDFFNGDDAKKFANALIDHIGIESPKQAQLAIDKAAKQMNEVGAPHRF